jgi:hypothetical protein
VENLVLNDDNQSPAAGMAKVRFVHAGADVPAVDIAVAGGPTLFHNIGFKGVAGPIAVPVGTYTLQVRAAGTSTLLLLLPNIVLTEGQNLTLFGAGLRSDQTLTVVVLPYAPVASPLATDAAAAVAPTTPLPAVAGLSTTGTGGAVSARSGRVPWLALLSLLLLAGAGTLWHVARRY